MKIEAFLCIRCIIFIFCLEICISETIYVNNVNDFIHIRDRAAQGHFKFDIVLETDLNLTGNVLALPLGTSAEDDHVCMPFTGVFNGNNHIIYDLVMDNSANANFSDAALFCGLNGSSIVNLVVDKSCLFSGSTASAITLKAYGSNAFESVTVIGDVSGSLSASGFISQIVGVHDSTVLFKGCENQGTTRCTSPNATAISSAFVGEVTAGSRLTFDFEGSHVTGTLTVASVANNFIAGYVGRVSATTNTKLSVVGCKNRIIMNASSTSGSSYVGGFVGMVGGSSGVQLITRSNKQTCFIEAMTNGKYAGGAFGVLYNNPKLSVSMHNEQFACSIKTEVNGDSDVGGIIGFIDTNSDSKVQLVDCIFDGVVHANSVTGTYCGTGGFVGRFCNNTKTSVIIINSTNNGMISNNGPVGGTLLGGFFGGMDNCNHQSSGTVLSFANCYNAGELSSTTGTVCGIFCTGSGAKFSSTVINSVNKGTIRGQAAHGIANTAGDVNNVVSMGSLGGNTTYSFWQSLIGKASHIYGLKDECKNCDNSIVQFTLDSKKLLYLTQSGDQVDALLNREVKTKKYTRYWTSDLELVSVDSCSRPSSLSQLLLIIILMIMEVSFTIFLH